MRKDEFHKLKKGDQLFYNGDDFYVDTVEMVFNHEEADEVAHTVRDLVGRSIKVDDPWLDEIQIILAAQYPPTYIRRIELYVIGIGEGREAWEFIMSSIEETIESYGGHVVEVDG